jgi:PLP dependent protein
MSNPNILDPHSPVSVNLDKVRERIAQAARRSGCQAGAIKLAAVSKTVEVDLMLAAIRSGVRILAENRVQEARDKWPHISEEMTRNGCEFHLVGHLQTNKSREAVRLFDLIQSVDSERLARALDQHAGEIGKTQRVLVEVNTSQELTKFGIEPENAGRLIQVVRSLKNLKLEGLMTVGPLRGGVEASRAAFRTLRELRHLSEGTEFLPELSMGMSGDFEIAIEEGATLIRVGTAIFGDRN